MKLTDALTLAQSARQPKGELVVAAREMFGQDFGYYLDDTGILSTNCTSPCDNCDYSECALQLALEDLAADDWFVTAVRRLG